MDILNKELVTGIRPSTGKLLVAEPLMGDPDFARTVILLCEHGSDGTIGFVLNRPLPDAIHQIVPELGNICIPVHEGGPVQSDTLHMLHRMPQLLGGVEVLPGLYWGGSYDSLVQALASPDFDPLAIRFFVGYSGWETGQLESELKERNWMVAHAFDNAVFNKNSKLVWQQAVRSLGTGFQHLAYWPIDPQLN